MPSRPRRAPASSSSSSSSLALPPAAEAPAPLPPPPQDPHRDTLASIRTRTAERTAGGDSPESDSPEASEARASPALDPSVAPVRVSPEGSPEGSPEVAVAAAAPTTTTSTNDARPHPPAKLRPPALAHAHAAPLATVAPVAPAPVAAPAAHPGDPVSHSISNTPSPSPFIAANPPSMTAILPPPPPRSSTSDSADTTTTAAVAARSPTTTNTNTAPAGTISTLPIPSSSSSFTHSTSPSSIPSSAHSLIPPSSSTSTLAPQNTAASLPDPPPPPNSLSRQLQPPPISPTHAANAVAAVAITTTTTAKHNANATATVNAIAPLAPAIPLRDHSPGIKSITAAHEDTDLNGRAAHMHDVKTDPGTKASTRNTPSAPTAPTTALANSHTDKHIPASLAQPASPMKSDSVIDVGVDDSSVPEAVPMDIDDAVVENGLENEDNIDPDAQSDSSNMSEPEHDPESESESKPNQKSKQERQLRCQTPAQTKSQARAQNTIRSKPSTHETSRREALAALAHIETYFALLQQRWYKARVAVLALDAARIRDGSHPAIVGLLQEIDGRHAERMRASAAHKRRLELQAEAVHCAATHEAASILASRTRDLRRRMLDRTRRRIYRLDTTRTHTTDPYHPHSFAPDAETLAKRRRATKAEICECSTIMSDYAGFPAATVYGVSASEALEDLCALGIVSAQPAHPYHPMSVVSPMLPATHAVSGVNMSSSSQAAGMSRPSSAPGCTPMGAPPPPPHATLTVSAAHGSHAAVSSLTSTPSPSRLSASRSLHMSDTPHVSRHTMSSSSSYSHMPLPPVVLSLVTGRSSVKKTGAHVMHSGGQLSASGSSGLSIRTGVSASASMMTHALASAPASMGVSNSAPGSPSHVAAVALLTGVFDTRLVQDATFGDAAAANRVPFQEVLSQDASAAAAAAAAAAAQAQAQARRQQQRQRQQQRRQQQRLAQQQQAMLQLQQAVQQDLSAHQQSQSHRSVNVSQSQPTSASASMPPHVHQTYPQAYSTMSGQQHQQHHQQRHQLPPQQPTQHHQPQIDVTSKGGRLYLQGHCFSRDDRADLFDNGARFTVTLLAIGDTELVVQRTDGSKTKLPVMFLADGRVQLRPKAVTM